MIDLCSGVEHFGAIGFRLFDASDGLSGLGFAWIAGGGEDNGDSGVGGPFERLGVEVAGGARVGAVVDVLMRVLVAAGGKVAASAGSAAPTPNMPRTASSSRTPVTPAIRGPALCAVPGTFSVRVVASCSSTSLPAVVVGSSPQHGSLIVIAPRRGYGEFWRSSQRGGCPLAVGVGRSGARRRLG